MILLPAGPHPFPWEVKRVVSTMSVPTISASTTSTVCLSDVFVQLGEAVDALAALDPADLSEVALADSLVVLRRLVDRQEGVFARLAHAGHTRGVGQGDGAVSTAAWLRHRTGMREGDAKASIESGAMSDLLAETGEAWRAGEISTGAARTITAARVADHDEQYAACESVFLEFARGGDLRSLRRATAHFANLARAEGREPRIPDGLHVSKSFGNRTVVSVELGDLAAETFVTALHAYTDPPSDVDPQPVSERQAVALVRMAEVALAHLADEGRTVANVSAVLDWTTLTDVRLGRCDGVFTGPIHADDIRQLLCDCSVSRVVTGPKSEVLDVGRSRRTVPPPMRRALVARDGGCRFPGCNRPPGFTEAHHVEHWIDGGSTALVNLVLFCDRHHHIVHLPGWSITFDGRDLHVHRPDGSAVT